jgi:hypothetical protein
MKVFVLIMMILFAVPAFSQTGNLHMIEMSTTTSTLGALTFSDDGSTTDKSGYVGANYAYRIAPRIQVGLQGNYSRFESGVTSETYNFMVGGILNFDDDITNAFYSSLYAGMGWNHYSGRQNAHRETLSGRVALGKRFAFKSLNLPNVTYSPEISYTRDENTKSAYGVNSVSIRFLQFSIFF